MSGSISTCPQRPITSISSTSGLSAPPMPDSGLLPEPQPMSASVMGDAMSELYRLISKQTQSATQRGEQRIETKHVEEKAASDTRLAADAKQAENADGPGFFEALGDIIVDTVTLNFDDIGKACEDFVNSPAVWDDILTGLKVLGTVAGAVAGVATGGVAGALIIAGVALSAVGSTDAQFHLLEKCGVDAELAGYLDAGAMIGGAALTLTGAFASFGSAGTSAATSATTTLKTAATLTSAGTSLAAGGATLALKHFQAAAKDAEADGLEAKFLQKQIQRSVDVLIEGIKEMTESSSRVFDSLRGAMESRQQTMIQLSAKV